MRKSIDVNELIKNRDDIREKLLLLPNKERDYTEYRKVAMKIKYYTNEDERKRQIEYGKKRFRKIYSNEEEREKYKEYQLNLYHNRKGHFENNTNNIVVY